MFNWKSGRHDESINHYPALSGKLRRAQSQLNQYRVSAICNPENGNKSLEQDGGFIVMSSYVKKAAVFIIT